MSLSYNEGKKILDRFLPQKTATINEALEQTAHGGCWSCFPRGLLLTRQLSHLWHRDRWPCLVFTLQGKASKGDEHSSFLNSTYPLTQKCKRSVTQLKLTYLNTAQRRCPESLQRRQFSGTYLTFQMLHCRLQHRGLKEGENCLLQWKDQIN